MMSKGQVSEICKICLHPVHSICPFNSYTYLHIRLASAKDAVTGRLKADFGQLWQAYHTLQNSAF